MDSEVEAGRLVDQYTHLLLHRLHATLDFKHSLWGMYMSAHACHMYAICCMHVTCQYLHVGEHQFEVSWPEGLV